MLRACAKPNWNNYGYRSSGLGQIWLFAFSSIGLYKLHQIFNFSATQFDRITNSHKRKNMIVYLYISVLVIYVINLVCCIISM